MGAGDTLIHEKLSILTSINFAKTKCIHLFDILMHSSNGSLIKKKRTKHSFSSPSVMHAGIIGFKYNLDGGLRCFSSDYHISSDFDWLCMCLSDGLEFVYYQDYLVTVDQYGLSGSLENLFRKKIEHLKINLKYEKSWVKRLNFQLVLLKTTITSLLYFIFRKLQC